MGLLNRVIAFANNLRKFMSPAVPKIDISPSVVKPKVYGTHGRLEIPELFISVPLYDATGGADRQRVVDDPDSAVFMHWQKQDAIADHASQGGFSNLNMAKVKRTIATIDQQTHKQSYVCVNSQIGHIMISAIGNRIYDENWEPAYTQNNGGLCIYTCIRKSANDVMDVRLTYWQPINGR